MNMENRNEFGETFDCLFVADKVISGFVEKSSVL